MKFIFKRKGMKVEKQYPLRDIYRRYNSVIKAVTSTDRGDFETDTELINRLRNKKNRSLEFLAGAEGFIHKYRAARFGNGIGNLPELEEKIKFLEESELSERLWL